MKFKQLQAWIFWKVKIRFIQTWGNFKLYNIENKYLVPFVAIFFRLIGMILTFILGFGIAYLYNRFIDTNPYNFWLIILTLYIFIDGTLTGLNTGRWISGTKEENWLLTSVPITKGQYLVFLWLDETIWTLVNTIFSNLAFVFGVYLVFPFPAKNIILILIGTFILHSFITFITCLLNYYIIKKSIYLKGKGMIVYILLPLISIPIIYQFFKYFTPWLIQYPPLRTDTANLINAYKNWFSDGLNVGRSLLEDFIFILDYWANPVVYLTNMLSDEGLFRNIVAFGIAILLSAIISILLIQLISSKDHKMYQSYSAVDKGIVTIIDTLIKQFPSRNIRKTHLKLFFQTLFNHYLIKRSFFVILGFSSVPMIVTAISFLHFLPEHLSVMWGTATIFLLSFFVPFTIATSIYHSFKIKLAFDSEGPGLQTLLTIGTSPDYLFQMKSTLLQIFSLPAALVMSLLAYLFIPAPLIVKIIGLCLTVVVWFTISQFMNLHSLLVPHYEYINLEQIGKYPDQTRMNGSIQTLITGIISPIIPVTMYLMGYINHIALIILSSVWITVGCYIVYKLLTKTKNIRLESFELEELNRSRASHTDKTFWKNKSSLLIITTILYAIGIVLSMVGEFLLAEIAILVPLIVMQLILINAYNKKTREVT